jgi:pantoate--beta-alanine ligase
VKTKPQKKQRQTDIFDHQQGMKLEYFLIADENTLKETDFFYKDRNYRAFIVVVVDGVRLIDNMHMD